MKSKFKKSLLCAAILSSSVAVANTALDSNNKKADYLDLNNINFKNLKSQQIKFFKKKITFIYARFFIHV